MKGDESKTVVSWAKNSHTEIVIKVPFMGLGQIHYDLKIIQTWLI